MMYPAVKTTRKQIKKVELAVPEQAGERWKGTQHEDLVAAIRSEANRLALPITKNTRYALNEDQSEVTACFDIDLSAKYTVNGYFFSLGVISGNNRRRAMTFFYGLGSVTETHGMCFGELKTRKHTTGTNIKDEVQGVFEEWMELIKYIKEAVDCMKANPLTTKQLDHILMETCRGAYKDRFKWSKLGLVDTLHRKHNVEIKKRSSWTLFEAFAKVVTECSANKQMDQLNKFRQLLPMADYADKAI